MKIPTIKRLSLYVLPLALAAVLAIRFWVYFEDRQFSCYLKGTYLCGSRYLTVLENGYYCDYFQGEVLEEGDCVRREPGIFRFTPRGGTGQHWELLALGDGTLYRTVNGEIWEYQRLTEAPQFFNAQPREG